MEKVTGVTYTTLGEPKSPSIIRQRALSWNEPYNPISCNSEHLATWCVYGIRVSGQSGVAAVGTGTAVATGIGGSAGAVIGGVIGSVVPIAGTAAGVVVGGTIGAGAGAMVGMAVTGTSVLIHRLSQSSESSSDNGARVPFEHSKEDDDCSPEENESFMPKGHNAVLEMVDDEGNQDFPQPNAPELPEDEEERSSGPPPAYQDVFPDGNVQNFVYERSQW